MTTVLNIKQIDKHFKRIILNADYFKKVLEQQTKLKKEQDKILSRLLLKFVGNPICSCNYPMVVRKNSINGQNFWGCTRFPSCRNTKRIQVQ